MNTLRRDASICEYGNGNVELLYMVWGLGSGSGESGRPRRGSRLASGAPYLAWRLMYIYIGARIHCAVVTKIGCSRRHNEARSLRLPSPTTQSARPGRRLAAS